MLTPQAILIRFYGLTAVAYCSKTRSSVRRKELTGKRPYILSGLGTLLPCTKTELLKQYPVLVFLLLTVTSKSQHVIRQPLVGKDTLYQQIERQFKELL